MSKKKTFFNPEWADSSLNPQWSPWLQAIEGSPNMARCTLCQRAFSLSNMGRQAIKSHMISSKHINAISMLRSSDSIKKKFYNKDVPKSNCEAQSPSIMAAGSHHKSCDMNSFVTKDNVLAAELLWGMKLVYSHVSFNSFNDAALLFQAMFDDSEKAKSMSLGRSKMSYLVTFGLAPYFKMMLISELKYKEYVICFDEALNRIIQRGQMDLFVRFWDDVKNEVSTRYLTSIFLGHATAQDLLRGFLQGTSELDKKKLLQVSLDGPNVNLRFLKNLKENLENEDLCHLLDIGSCGLHVVHGAFRYGHGATDWNLNLLFKDMHRLFKDSPARRADYISITDCKVFPLKFCEVRWCENILVAERAMDVLPHITKYIEESKLPKTASVERLKDSVKDKLLLAKISFFISVAGILHPFLKSFQTADPMCPFLYASFYRMLNQLISKFVKREIIQTSMTAEKLMKIDVTDQMNYCSIAEVDLGIAAGANLSKSGVSDLRKREFRNECRTFLVKLSSKIIERSPFKYKFVKYLSALDPKFIMSNTILSEKRMENLLLVLYENDWINSVAADKSKIQYKELLLRSRGMWKDVFTSYSSRIDHFYRDLLMSESDFQELWRVIKLVLILSHGNASVESGFSVNKDMLVENLHEKSLIGMRTVYHAIKASGGIMNIKITSDMLRYARSARCAYHLALETEKKSESEEKKVLSEKRKVKTQIKILECKKQKLSRDISLEVTAIDSQIAELKQKI